MTEKKSKMAKFRLAAKYKKNYFVEYPIEYSLISLNIALARSLAYWEMNISMVYLRTFFAGIPHADSECNDTVILGFMIAQGRRQNNPFLAEDVANGGMGRKGEDL